MPLLLIFIPAPELCGRPYIIFDSTNNFFSTLHPSFVNKIPTPYSLLFFPTHPTALSFHITDRDDKNVLSGAVPSEPGNFLVFCFLACSYIIVSITKVPIISFPTRSRTRSAASLLLLLFFWLVLFHFLLATTLMFATQKLINAISQPP